MPELPEVETIRASLMPILIGRSITRTRILHRPAIATASDPRGGYYRQRDRPDPDRLPPVPGRLLLAHATIADILRRGKQLAIIAADRRALIIQLGMTGHLAVLPPRAPLPPHTHAVWTLDNLHKLIFSDPRRFGLIRTITDFDPEACWADLGPDALTIRAPALRAALANSSAPIKARLLDQAALAGVGNIYADEALFAARVHPTRPAGSLTPAETTRLATAIRHTLRLAVRARGSSIRSYTDPDGNPGGFQARHAVYGRAGRPCPSCGRPLSQSQVAQRTTVACNHCQR